MTTQDKPLGAPGITANIEYYLAREQKFEFDAQTAREEREHWERELKRVQRRDQEE